MRLIEKENITSVFSNPNLKDLKIYVNKQLAAQPDSLHPDYAGLNGQMKKKLIEQLIIEQKGLCCYCLQRFEAESYHIEHMAPQSAYKNEEVNYYNLFLSCGSNKSKKIHCGHHKKEYIIPKVISYYNPKQNTRCQDLFKYSLDGEILPMEGKESMHMNFKCYKELNGSVKSLIATIEVLNLNCTELVSIRKKIIEGIFNLPDIRIDLEKALSLLEIPDSLTGFLDPFCELSIYFLKFKISKL